MTLLHIHAVVTLIELRSGKTDSACRTTASAYTSAYRTKHGVHSRAEADMCPTVGQRLQGMPMWQKWVGNSNLKHHAKVVIEPPRVDGA